MILDSDQQKGIIGLALVILLLTGFIYGLRNRTTQSAFLMTTPEEQEVRLFLDSVRQDKIDKEDQKPIIFPFNPNFITDYRGYVLGLSVEEIDRIKAYREAGLWVNSKEEFQQVTRISDSLLEAVAPYFKFPEWVNNSAIKKTSVQTSERSPQIAQKDLNTATVQDLKTVRGIGEVLANRIVRYRDRLGGFLGEAQLKDVYGLKTQARMAVLEQFTVIREEPLIRQDLNSISTGVLAEIPYFDYELARKIVDYRTTHKKIDSFEELNEIEGFPYYKMEQIKLYLKIEGRDEEKVK